jgi:anti-anti-sigma regulatory factor
MITSMLPLHPTRPRLASRRLLRFALRMVRRLEADLARRSVPPVHRDRLSVTVVDDPTGRLRLIGVRGPLTGETAPTLAATLDAVPDGGSLHLDVTNATLTSPLALDQVERMIDLLELRGVGIRIVGLDPRHPALSRQYPR